MFVESEEPIQFLCRPQGLSLLILSARDMLDRIMAKSSGVVELFAPAKINLFLAVNGKRGDGYHEITTVLSKLSIGDSIKLIRNSHSSDVTIKCPGFKELENENNLVYKAATRWFHKSKEKWGVEVVVSKKIPPMSGLGGGSSDAISTLLGMNEIGDQRLPDHEMIELASKIGSDCPSFFYEGPCLAEGRGESLRGLNQKASGKVLGRKVFLFRPAIGLSTADSYSLLAKSKSYSSKPWATSQINAWENDDLPIQEFLHNDFEVPVFEKHRYFQPLFERIENKFNISSNLSGSGSCCFCFLPEPFNQLSELRNEIYRAWGEESWLQTAEIIA